MSDSDETDDRLQTVWVHRDPDGIEITTDANSEVVLLSDKDARNVGESLWSEWARSGEIENLSDNSRATFSTSPPAMVMPRRLVIGDLCVEMSRVVARSLGWALIGAAEGQLTSAQLVIGPEHSRHDSDGDSTPTELQPAYEPEARVGA